MKRVARSATSKSTRVPVEILSRLGGIEQTSDSGLSASPCWRCPDSPCTQLSDEEVALPTISDLGSSVPTTEVCPVGAISPGHSGEPVIDQLACFDCGLCQSRCPVGAIEAPRGSSLPSLLRTEHFKSIDNDFFELRAAYSASFSQPAVAGKALNDRLEAALQRLSVLKPAEKYAALRLFARNVFIRLSARASLRVQGANSFLTELVAESEGFTFLVEIETNDDTLDAFRRLLSASARAITSEKKAVSEVIPIMVVPQLPNKRVDLYRLIADAKRYLGLEVRVLPYSALIAAIYTEQPNPVEAFGKFVPDPTTGSLKKIAREQFWVGVEKFGFSPAK